MNRKDKDTSASTNIATLIILIVAILAGYGMYWHFSQPYTRTLRRNTNILDVPFEGIISEDIPRQNTFVRKEKTLSDDNNFKPRYFIIYNSLENLSLPNTPRFSLKVSVPLGLSEDELKQNLSHAAWRLLEEKNANAVIIWGYRDDDRLRAGGFSAGKCTLAPFGDWSKATQKYTFNDMQTTFELAEVYNNNTPPYDIGSKAVVNKNNALLYPNEDFDPDDTKISLRKGTVVTIMGHYREFVTTEYLDSYKVSVNKQKHIGWILGNNLNKFVEKHNVKNSKRRHKTK